MKIRFFGATRRVTGSCFLLESEGVSVLVDCGMYQGKDSEDLNWKAFPFNPKEIDCLFLTHAHLDHSGLIPKLAREGYQGCVITTAATADLVEIMLYDSAHIQEKDAEWLTRKNFRMGKEEVVKPLYNTADVDACLPLFERKAYNVVEDLDGVFRYRFIDAGHILGSGTLEIWFKGPGGEKKIVFSGDVGKKGNFIIRDPEHVGETDYVVMESTYGNRYHKGMEESIDELAEAVEHTLKRKGNVLIPAFSVGRTQDILYVLSQLVREGRLGDLNVYVDSPLATKATKVYLDHPEYLDEESLRLFKFRGIEGMKLHFTATVEESQQLNKIRSGAIIIAGSGMCEGGRIRHHFKHNLWRPECSVIFTGFQVRGTLGRYIVDGAKRVRVLGEELAVRARIYTIGGFSAHADQGELIEWLGAFSRRPEKVFLVHGEEQVSLEFEKVVQRELGLVTYVPSPGEGIEL